MKSWKDNITFVLVEPSEWGNIGASARALKNMGFARLCLINPPGSGKEEARRLARNSLDVLDSASVCPTLGEAVRDMSVVAGTTRRRGRKRGVFYDPPAGLSKVFETAADNPVAIVFGRERTGLTNDEIEECGFLISIKTESGQPSLNLSKAVLIIAYELSKYGGSRHEGRCELVSRKEIDALYKRLPGVLKLLEYIPSGDMDMEKKILTNFKHFVGRAGLTGWELKMLHGLCTRLERKLKGD